ILLRQKQKKLIMLPSETMIWQPEFTDKTLSRKPGAVHRIQDADYATEVSNMSKAQIIQQAGNSVLAKANQVPQQVLSLLQG
uniref:flagellin n=3 Tax=Escherichia coli TaxID=562 RepID=UPI0021BF34E0